ncbi:hypothetical protein FXO38_27149 [Capsicum annuum]|nr:hypothetical protein FXO38_27149 [Capsicum annuum]
MHVLKVKLSLGCRFEAFEAVVVQLKAIASSLSAGEALSNTVAEKTAILQSILLYVVSIICSFINLHFSTSEMAWMYSGCLEIFGPRSVEIRDVVTGVDVSYSEIMIRWRQKAIVSIMETGSLNCIGGLAVLLDGLGVASNSALRLRDSTSDAVRNVFAEMF